MAAAFWGDSWEAPEGHLLPDEESHFSTDLLPELWNMQVDSLFGWKVAIDVYLVKDVPFLKL